MPEIVIDETLDRMLDKTIFQCLEALDKVGQANYDEVQKEARAQVFRAFGALRFKLGIVSLVKNEATEKFDLSQSIFNEKPTSQI